MNNKEVIKILKNSGVIYSKGNYTPNDLEQVIDLAIKALENAPKKGKWVDNGIYYECPFCHAGYMKSICEKTLDNNKMNFCFNCGADMREADND